MTVQVCFETQPKSLTLIQGKQSPTASHLEVLPLAEKKRMSGKKRKKRTIGILQYGSLSPSQKQHKIRRIYSIWKRCSEKVTGRPTLHPPEGGNRLQTIKNFQAPSIPAYLHFEISFSPLKKNPKMMP